MQCPSSVIATTPACASDPIGASSSPARPFEIAPVGKTFTDAPAARFLIHAIVLGLSATGDVFGMQTIVVNPPAAAARAPDSIVSLWLNPGSRRWTCMSIKPGATMSPLASTSSISDFGLRISALEATIFPSSMQTSPTSSRLFAGSITRPWRMIVALMSRRDSSTKIQNSHAHGEPVGDLVENDALQAVGDFTVTLDAAVDRPRMHDQTIGFQKLRPLFG